jgi:hypothetical protein
VRGVTGVIRREPTLALFLGLEIQVVAKLTLDVIVPLAALHHSSSGAGHMTQAIACTKRFRLDSSAISRFLPAAVSR